jgi:hypothetical protein
MRRLALVLACLAAPGVTAAGLAAQSVTLEGRLLDGAGAYLPAELVVLHVVTEGAGGELVARDSTDAEGRFRFDVLPTADAVYFAALRRGDTLYVGPPIRLPEEMPEQYLLVVSPETALTMGPATTGTGPGFAPPPQRRVSAGRGTLPWLVGLLAAVGAWLAYRRYATRRDPDEERRWLLVELAELDERFADRQDLEPGTRAEYLRRRAQLESRIREDAAAD